MKAITPTPCRALNGCFAGLMLLLFLTAVTTLLLVWAVKKLLDATP